MNLRYFFICSTNYRVLAETPNTRYFVSTMDGNQPRVRPFSFVMEYEGKICFATSNQKLFYLQLMANPNIEIYATTKDARWLRLSGKAVFCTTMEAKAQVKDAM